MSAPPARSPERGVGSAPNQLPGNDVSADQLALVFQLELAGNGGKRGIDVGNSGYDLGFTGDQRAALRVGDDILQHADRETLRHTGPAVDAFVSARLEGNALDDLGDELRHTKRRSVSIGPRFLARDFHPELHRLGVMQSGSRCRFDP